MSVERGLFLVLVSLILYLLTDMNFQYVIGVILIIFLYKKVSVRYMILFTLLLVISSFINFTETPDNLCGTVVDVRDKVTIISIGKNEYSMFDQEELSLHDQVCVTGTVTPLRIESTFVTNPVYRWSNQRNHRGTIDVESIEVVKKGLTITSRIFEHISKIDSSGWLKAFLFDHPSPIIGHFTTVFVSGGLIASSLVSLIKGLFGYIFYEKKRQYFVSLIIGICWLLTGGSFVLTRILLSDAIQYFKLKPLAKISLAYVLLLVLYPHHVLHPGLVIPLTLSLINVFNYPRFLTRMAILPCIQTLLMYRFDFLSAILFPILRIISVICYLFAWICLIWPSLVTIFIRMCEWLSFNAIPFASYFRMTGHPGIILSLFWVMAIFGARISNKQLIIRMSVLLLLFQLKFILNPFTTVTFFNVAQADSALIELPFNQGKWLIDTGRSGTSGLLRANLLYRGISRLDKVFISHDDSDHNGGLEMLQRDFYIDKVYKEHMSENLEHFLLISLIDQREETEDNDNSLVHYFSVNGLSYLFLGDISKEKESELIRQYPFLKADIVKLAHHGSKTSTSQRLLSHIQPRLAIISADPQVYGHPHKITLKSLWQFKIPYLATYRDGDIRISTLGNFHLVMSSAGGFGIMRTVIK